MAEQICPASRCTIEGKGSKKGGVTYCCKQCATGSQCECGCCSVVGEENEQ